MGGLRRLLTRLTYQQVTVAELQIHDAKRELHIFGSYAFFYILASFCTGLLIRAYPIPLLGAAGFTQDLWYDLLFKIVLLLIVPYVIYKKLGYHLRDLPATMECSTRAISVLILAFLAGNILNLGHLDWIGEKLPNYTGPEIATRIGMGLVLPLITAGFPEEFVYRGILQTRIEAVWGRVAGILIATTLFTAWHLPTRYLLSRGIEGEAGNFGSVLVGTGIPVFIVGAIFGFLWDRYRKFWPLVAAHSGIDTLPAISSLFGILR